MALPSMLKIVQTSYIFFGSMCLGFVWLRRAAACILLHATTPGLDLGFCTMPVASPFMRFALLESLKLSLILQENADPSKLEALN